MKKFFISLVFLSLFTKCEKDIFPIHRYIFLIISTITNDSISISYPTSSLIFTVNLSINPTITPKITGTISKCSSSPTLPSGLTINNTTCAISGTPTTAQSATNYTITASNSTNSITTSISISVLDNLSITYTGSPYTFTKDIVISTSNSINNWNHN